MDLKIAEIESKLKSKENENLELCSKLATIQQELRIANKNQKRLAEENERLNYKLKTPTTIWDSREISEVFTNYEESKAESKIYSSQLDLLEEDVSDLERENKDMLVEIQSLHKTIKNLTKIKEEKEDSLENANKEIYELKQIVSLLEFVVEETSTHNLALQKKCSKLHNNQKRKGSRNNPPNKNVSGRKSFCLKMKATEEPACNLSTHTNEDIPETINDNLSIEDKSISVSTPHCAVYLGLFMKAGRFPCKCGKDFGTKQDLKAHTINENRKAVRCSDCARTFSSNVEMERHINSFHKQAYIPKNYNNF